MEFVPHFPLLITVLTISRSILVFLCIPACLRAGQVIFSEVMYHPSGAQPEYIEITNLSSNRWDAAKWTLSGGVDYTFPDFNASAVSSHLLKEYERIIVSSADEATTRAAWPALPASVRVFGPWTGSLNNSGDNIVLSDASNTLRSQLSYGDSGDWPVAADGAGHSLQIINQNGNVDDFRNWRASKYNGGSPGAPEPVLLEEPMTNPDKQDRTIVDFTSSWKYWKNADDPDGLDPEGTWFATNYAETGWEGPSPGFFGHDPNNGDLQAARGTSFTAGYLNATRTYYFRTTFNWSGSLTGQTFNLDQWVDDGVIYYLNGVELGGADLGRVRMAAGVASHTSTASTTPAGGDAVLETNVKSGSLDGRLVAGANLLCAEVHQTTATLDDIYFGARLRVNSPGTTGGVVINEVRPFAGTGPNAGFVEFYNPTAADIDLNGYYLSDSDFNLTKFKISTSTIVPAGGVVARDYTGSGLSTGSPVTVLLTQPDGLTRQAGFASSMLIDGRSAGRKPSGGGTWVLYVQPTRGLLNVTAPAPTLALSEVNFAPTNRADWVEVYNTGTSSQALTGYFVSSRSDLVDRVALSGSLPAGGYGSASVNFNPATNGDLTLYLSDSTNNILSTAEVTRLTGFPSVQAWPAGSGEWYNTPLATRDASNDPERQTAIVINEIMAKPPSSHDDGEFVELFNQSATAVNLTGWKFTDGIGWTFPAGTNIAAGQYLILGKNPAYLKANYPGLTNVQGPFDGALRNSGDKLRLEDARANLADLVDYKMGGQWPTGAGGEGSSLELLHPAMDNSQPSSWRASNETNKSTFQTFTYTGIYKELRGLSPGASTSRELLLNMVGDGYVILRNIQLSKAAAPTVNMLAKGDATSHSGNGTTNGANGFLCTGTHCDSDTLPRVATPVRYDATLTSDPGFHLISTGTGDTKANLAQADLTGLLPNDVLTLTFEGRWVYGMPRMVAQTWDRSFGNVFHFPIPNNLGTPGVVNSRATAAPPPTVDSMAHFPVVPTATQPVVESARVASATALTGVSLIQRLDSANLAAAWTTQAMNDTGADGDVVAGDGVWSASVPARADKAITQFYIKATTANGQETECPREGARLPGLWIVSNTKPSTLPGILIERSILSQYHRNALNEGTGFSAAYDWDHPRMSNFGFNSTFIFNETEVYYNCEIRRGGSPWTRTGSNTLDRTRWKPPGDQLFRGLSKSGVDNDSAGASRFHNRMMRYMLHLFGYPVPDAEFIQQIVNGDAPRLGDDMEQTDADFFDRAYVNGSEEGELFEIDDAWFMYDTNNMNDRISADSVTGRWSIRDYGGSAAVPSDESPIFYHGNWPIRFPEAKYDYGTLSSMIKTATNNNTAVTVASEAGYLERMSRALDFERAAIYTAVRGFGGDWDNFTLNRGKNGYFYRRPDGKFEFHHWDSDLAFQNTGEGVVGTTGAIGWTNLTARPAFRQKINYYMSSLIDNFANVNSARMNAWLSGLNYQSGLSAVTLAPFKTSGFSYTGWFSGRRAAALAYVTNANYARAFAITTASDQTVAAPLFSISGSASSKVAYVEIVGHPEAVFAWTPTVVSNTGLWTLSNIALANGLNSLTLRTIQQDGSVGGTLPFAVTLSANGPPILALVYSPASGNVAVSETLELDATASKDPEGTALKYAWTIVPSEGVTLTQPSLGKATARFSTPGNYTLSLQVSDAVPLNSVLIRDFTVFNSSDFNSVGNGEALGPEFTVSNMEVRDNFSASNWYSVEDLSGRILIQVLEDAAKPLAAPAGTYPSVTRDLPDTADFILQTGFLPDTREFGNWKAGLLMQLNEGGTTVQYAFGVDGGLNLLVQRAALPADFTTLSTTPITGSGAALRVMRLGNNLLFQNRTATGWATLFTQAIPAGSVAGNGGIFVATSQPTTARIGFDYLLVADPSDVSSALNNLRITELHYHPAAGGVEFIELRNTGTSPIDLNGVSFGQGQPFSMAGNPVTAYTFGALSLAAGEYIVITSDTALFRRLYGNGPRLAPDWTSGGLNNGGERILLLDANGKTILDFSYGVDPPWPVAPDGSGPSLDIVDTTGDYAMGTNWRASSVVGGTPGTSPAPVALDTDGDGFLDAGEALFGTNPNNPISFPAATLTASQDGTMTLTWPSIQGVVYRVESSTPLSGWQVLQSFNGTGSYTFTPAPGEERRFYRVSATGQ